MKSFFKYGGSNSEGYYNKQGQAVKGVYFFVPSVRQFSPLAINPENKTLGFLGRVFLTSKGLPQTVDVTKDLEYDLINKKD